MADRRHHLLFLIFFLLYPSLSLSTSRHLTRQATATFDVSASLSQALSAASFDPSSLSHHPFDQDLSFSLAADYGGTLTLRLHSRDFLPPSSSSFSAAATAAEAIARHPDYKSLALSRLRRDEVRVRSISARLALALGGLTTSDLKPLEEELSKEAFEASAAAIRGPIVSGTSQGSGEYFSRVGVGNPPESMYVVLDTGSDVTWIQCQPCIDCYQQSDPVFDPASSSSYAALPCSSPRCRALDVSACRNSTGSCLYQVSYGDGSYTVGDFATETVTFGGSAPVSGVAIGCGHDNEGLFTGAAGLLALGGGKLSFPSQIGARSFSYCLVDRDSPSSSTLDLVTGSATSNGAGSGPAAAVTAPLLRNQKLDTFYYVGLTGISVGGEMLSIPPSSFAMDESGAGGVIVDSGTAVTRLQNDAYAALRDAFRQGTADLPAASGVSLFDTCYDLSGRTSVEVPTVSLHFPDSEELRLPAKNYLIPVDAAGTYCLAFAPTATPLSIIGNVQQQGTRVTFDLKNEVVGFTPNKC